MAVASRSCSSTACGCCPPRGPAGPRCSKRRATRPSLPTGPATPAASRTPEKTRECSAHRPWLRPWSTSRPSATLSTRPRSSLGTLSAASSRRCWQPGGGPIDGRSRGIQRTPLVNERGVGSQSEREQGDHEASRERGRSPDRPRKAARRAGGQTVPTCHRSVGQSSRAVNADGTRMRSSQLTWMPCPSSARRSHGRAGHAHRTAGRHRCVPVQPRALHRGLVRRHSQLTTPNSPEGPPGAAAPSCPSPSASAAASSGTDRTGADGPGVACPC